MSGIVAVPSGSGVLVVPDSGGADGPPGATGPTGTIAVSGLTFRTPQQHGALANDGADDAASFNDLITAIKSTAITGYQYGNAGGRAYVPQGGPAYRLSATIDVDVAARFEADGTGYGPGIWASLLHPDAGVTAVRIQSDTTTGESGTKSSTPFTGNGALASGIGVIGHYNGTTNLEVATGGHAYHLRATASLRDGGISDMQGDGVHIHAGVATVGFIGNANFWEVSRFLIQNCTNGISTKYSDSNAGLATQVTFSGCREWGFKNESGASNFLLACLFQSNGVSGDGTTNKPAAACHSSGHHYYVRIGQETWCSTNAPTGTTSDNTGWGYFEDGGISTGYPAWFNGIVCRAGGSLGATTAILGVGLYFEGSQPPPQLSGDSLLLGGTNGGPVIGGGYINASSNKVLLNDVRILAGGIICDDDHSASFILPRYSSSNPAFLQCSSLATGMTITSPDNTPSISIQNAEIDLYPFTGKGVYLVKSSGNLAPFGDNLQDFGNSGHRWANLWCANATIQTSDAQHKSHVRDLAHPDFDTLLDAVGAVPLVAFKFKDAVAAKGDAARDHYGIVAQDLHDELVKRGLDPFAGGVLGRDTVLEEFEEEVEIEQEAMRTEYFNESHVEIVDGKAIRRMGMVPREIADWVHLPVHDEEGNPVIIPARPATKKKAIVDGELKDVQVPASPERQETHKVRRMEKVKAMVSRQRVKLDANGNEEFIWSVRYNEFFALRQAWAERRLKAAVA